MPRLRGCCLRLSARGALVPTALILRKLIHERLFSIVTGLVVFYFVDELRVVASSHQLVSRLLFLAEMLAAAISD